MEKTQDSSTGVTILDYIDGISVLGNVFAQPANEYWALVSLHDGLRFLYRQAAQFDNAVRQRLNPKLKIMLFGNAPELAGIPQGLLTCAFHWYAISACQYVRAVGAIAYRQNNTRPLPLDYVNAVIPEVLAFRDKVAAHFAWTTENKRDSDAERLASIMPPLTFIDDSFFVGAYTVAVRRSGKTTNSGAIKPWSITKVHERMCKRYWPNEVTKSVEKENLTA